MNTGEKIDFQPKFIEDLLSHMMGDAEKNPYITLGFADVMWDFYQELFESGEVYLVIKDNKPVVYKKDFIYHISYDGVDIYTGFEDEVFEEGTVTRVIIEKAEYDDNVVVRVIMWRFNSVVFLYTNESLIKVINELYKTLYGDVIEVIEIE